MKRALLIASIALTACFSTPTDPNAGRMLELPPSPDGGDDAGKDAGATDSGAAIDSATTPDTGSSDSGGGG